MNKLDNIHKWIEEFVSSSRLTNPDWGSDRIAEEASAWAGSDITESTVKDAMIDMGYYPAGEYAECCFYRIRVTRESTDMGELQRKLLPEQNEVLKAHIMTVFPNATAVKKRKRTNSYEYSGVKAVWHLARGLNRYNIEIFADDESKNPKKHLVLLPVIKKVGV